MSNTPKRAAGRKAGGSRAAKTFQFRGATLKRPTKLPDTIGFDIAQVQLRARQGETDEAVTTIHQILEEVLGSEELQKVRPTIKGLLDPWQRELLEKVISLDGLSLGEA